MHKILCHYSARNGITSCKNAHSNDNTLFPLLGHILSGKLKSYMMVGLSKSFKLLATREGPAECGYNYAMEKEQGKLDGTEGNRKGEEKREHYSKEWKQQDGETCHCEIR